MNKSLSDLYQLFIQRRKICTDSRIIASGSIFFALKGDLFNGNNFASQAIEKGAVCAVVDDKKYENVPQCLLVDNVVNTLQKLATHHRKQMQIPVIGITGTNGKTTTKELTGNILAKKFNVIFTKGNLNNHIGVPLSVLSLTPETEIAVIEMGANHVGEIASLCQISQPTHGIITNVGRAHLEGFGGFEGVIKAKSELYDYLKKKQGQIFLNAADDLLIGLGTGIRSITYGNNAAADLRGEIKEKFPFLAVKIHFKSGTRLIKTKLVGEYNFGNIMAAASIGECFEVEPDLIADALENYFPANNRSQFIKSRKNQIIMDAYNANPTSMESAILSFSGYPGTEKIAILGDMLELGEESQKEHHHILELALDQNFETVFVVGTQFCDVLHCKDVQGFNNVDQAYEYFKKHPLQNKTILVKASRGIKLEKLLGLL